MTTCAEGYVDDLEREIYEALEYTRDLEYKLAEARIARNILSDALGISEAFFRNLHRDYDVLEANYELLEEERDSLINRVEENARRRDETFPHFQN